MHLLQMQQIILDFLIGCAIIVALVTYYDLYDSDDDKEN
jgi:hypothetical protein